MALTFIGFLFFISLNFAVQVNIFWDVINNAMHKNNMRVFFVGRILWRAQNQVELWEERFDGDILLFDHGGSPPRRDHLSQLHPQKVFKLVE